MIDAIRLFWILIASIIVTIFSAIVEQATLVILPGVSTLAFVVKTFSLIIAVTALGTFFIISAVIVFGVVIVLVLAFSHFLCGYFSRREIE